MIPQTTPIVDTNIIPDRNVGIGSLLWDLQNPQDPQPDGPPLLGPAFAFIDVGVSRARVSTALKTLLANDLKMDVDYVATERPEAVPYANVTPLGERAEKIRKRLSAVFSSEAGTCEVKHWHFVVEVNGKVSSVTYSYHLHGNEVWESYFMGRTFRVAGEQVEYSNPTLNQMLAPDVRAIEARIDLERKRDSDPVQPAPSWDGYQIEWNPLEAGLMQFGIALQATDVPQRIEGRQNVLFLGNVLNHYPQHEQPRVLDRIAANLEEGDLAIIQMDEVKMSFIEVLSINRQGNQKTRERVRWIDTKKLEVHQRIPGSASWRQISLKPEIQRITNRFIECLGINVNSPAWSHKDHNVLVYQHVSRFFATFFRALPVEKTLCIAIQEALRRLPSGVSPIGTPVFKGDPKDVRGGAVQPGSNHESSKRTANSPPGEVARAAAAIHREIQSRIPRKEAGISTGDRREVS